MSDINQKRDALSFILERHSQSDLQEPVPQGEELKLILEAGLNAPDHGRLRPYRFVIVAGEDRQSLADAFVDNVESAGETNNEKRDKAAKKAFAAPMQIILVFSPKESKIPEWEQSSTCACAGYGISLAANKLGYGTIWKSIMQAPGPKMKHLLQLDDNETILGWINIGTVNKARGVIQRPAIESMAKRLSSGKLDTL